ncbi:nuclear transport factor 2 family protein [Curtobacterium sp. VKM Ac-1393]|nr:nuclear transport factor 2 family protein [Curtobacterium sp. VKM Ac-1393]
MDGPAVSLVVETFTPDAVVVDDGNTYTGHAAIRAWLSGPANQFTTTSTWLFVRPADRGTEVGILIEGDFPGGRVELRYDFTHDRDGLIEALTISI